MLIVLGIFCILALVGGLLDLDWSIMQYAYIPHSILGMLIVGKILMWDWNEKKKDSNDKTFKLRK